MDGISAFTQTGPLYDWRHPGEPESRDEVEAGTPRLRSFEFSTTGLARSEQFSVWQKSWASLLDLMEILPPTTGFHGCQKVWDLGALILAEISTDRVAFKNTPERIRSRSLDHWMITLVQSGSMVTHTEREQVTTAAGEMQIGSLGRSFTGSYSKSRMLVLFIPRDFSFETSAKLSSPQLAVVRSGLGRLFSDYLRNVARRLPTLTQDQLPELAVATRSMMLACLSPSADHFDAAEGPIASTLRERARRFIQSRLLDQNLSSECLRRELAVSRTRLYGLFEPFGGVMHYIQHRRLLEAYAALSDPTDDRPIFQIAEERFFNDGAQFSRAFKRAFGESPSEVRKHRGAGMPRRDGEDCDCPPEARLGILLSRLRG
jgi:AraC-like DNA-binding protein